MSSALAAPLQLRLRYGSVSVSKSFTQLSQLLEFLDPRTIGTRSSCQLPDLSASM